MSRTRTRRRVVTRVVSGTSAAWGLALLARPDAIAAAVSPGGPEPRTWVVRLLGARLLAQHALVLLRPTRGPVVAGAAVDTVHALSMGVIATASTDYRRSAAVSGVTATVAAASGWLTAPQADR